MVERVALVLGLAAHIDAELLEQRLIRRGDDDREERIATPELRQAREHTSRHLARCRGDRQRDERLIRVQTRVPASELRGLEPADGLDGLVCDDLKLHVDAGHALERIHEKRACSTETLRGFTGHDRPIG